MKSLFEELGGTYTLGKDGMYYPNLAIEETDQRSIGKWGRMHREYLKEQHPSLYQRLILNGTMGRHLAYANGRATAMLESLITQMVKQEGTAQGRTAHGMGRQDEQYSQPSRRDRHGRSHQYPVTKQPLV